VTLRGEVDAGGSEVGVEEVLEAGAGPHEVEEVAEGLGLAEVQLGLVCTDVIVHLESGKGSEVYGGRRMSEALEGR